MRNIKELTELGNEFYLDLLYLFFSDHVFAKKVVKYLKPDVFTSDVHKRLVSIAHNYYKSYDAIPTFDHLRIEIRSINATSQVVIDQLLDEVDIIEKNININPHVAEITIDFCNFQSLKNVVRELNGNIDKGNVLDYDEIQHKFKSVFIKADLSKSVELFDNMEYALTPDYREPIPTGIVGIDEKLNGGIAKQEVALVLAPTGVGKAQPLTSKVLTPNGWELMGNIKTNDLVITSTGKSTKVLGVFPQQGERDVYEITFSDGSIVECDINHLWSVNTAKLSRKFNDEKFITLSLEEILNGGYLKGNKPVYRIPLTEPIEFNNNNIILDPYIMGCLIGSDKGILNTVIIKDDFIAKKITNRNTLAKLNKKGNNYHYRVSNIYMDYSTIPNNYLYNSKTVRLDLLCGLLDTNSKIDKQGNIIYKTKFKNIVHTLSELVNSLGGISTYKQVGKNYIIKIYFNKNLNIFSLPSKVEKYNSINRKPKYRYISDIKYKGKEKTQCILVEDDKHEYITDNYIVTHNTTFLTKVANEAYMKGYNVVQLFFEDKIKDIQRKHFTCITQLAATDLALTDNRDYVNEKLLQVQKQVNEKGNYLVLQRLPADGITMSDIRDIIKNISTTNGKDVDMLVLDYIDCLSIEGNSQSKEDWGDEGKIMRKLDALAVELNIACWTATQGNRGSTSTEVVKLEHTGGSIKKVQVAHVVISIGKTLQQKTEKLATIVFLKNRLGEDGVIFENCKFDNEMMYINVNECITEMGYRTKVEQNTEDKKQHLISEALKKYNR